MTVTGDKTASRLVNKNCQKKNRKEMRLNLRLYIMTANFSNKIISNDSKLGAESTWENQSREFANTFKNRVINKNN